ncbi:MAG: phage terminase large subunit [Alphaproteobacteria bacterium]
MPRNATRKRSLDTTVELAKLHTAQNELAASGTRFNVVRCGRRWGKTIFGIWRLHKGVQKPQGWFAPNYKYLLEAKEEIARVFAPIITHNNKQDNRIKFSTGGWIDFWSLDDPDAGRSREYATAIIDEAAKARHLEEAWTKAIMPTLAAPRGDAWFLSTPMGKNYFYELDRKSLDDPLWSSFHYPTSTNPFISPQELRMHKEQSLDLVFRQEYLAEYVDFAGYALKQEWLKHGVPGAHSPIVAISVGVDLAISLKQDADYTAMVAMAKDANGHTWVIDAFRGRMTFQEILNKIERFSVKNQAQVVTIENVQFQATVAQELLRTTDLNIRTYTPRSDKFIEAQPLLLRYENGMVYHANDLPGYFEEEWLSFPPQSKTEHDDLVDASKLAYHGLKHAGGLMMWPTSNNKTRRTVTSGNVTQIGWGTTKAKRHKGYL